MEKLKEQRHNIREKTRKTIATKEKRAQKKEQREKPENLLSADQEHQALPESMSTEVTAELDKTTQNTAPLYTIGAAPS